MALTTSEVGITPQGNALVYVPPNVTLVPRGSTVVYGDWVSIDVGGSLPPNGVIEIQAGAAPVVPGNLGLWRTVQLVPL